ncbi:MAG: toll/interleukin-1 receptor domain-containing protein [Limisphaerales bacterium]
MPRAFLSHSTADDLYVAELESFLRAAGFDDVFNDVHAITPDELFWPRIQEGIAGSDALIIVITAASGTSTWVAREVEYARSLSKKVIPLWTEDCPLPPTFAGRDVIDLRRAPASSGAPTSRGSSRTWRAAVGVAPTASETQTSSRPGSQLDEASRRDAGLRTPEACAPLI